MRKYIKIISPALLAFAFLMSFIYISFEPLQNTLGGILIVVPLTVGLGLFLYDLGCDSMGGCQ